MDFRIVYINQTLLIIKIHAQKIINNMKAFN
jgi:hypothetical protein